MNEILEHIIAKIQDGQTIDERALTSIVNHFNQGKPMDNRHTKRKIVSYFRYLQQKDRDTLEAMGVDEAIEDTLSKILKIKPQRTASGVATITILTKPWRCSSDCLYCPNDIRMPKSYMHEEPGAQRAELNFFDPYLQVSMRLKALEFMGHVTDKIELIVLGGTWADYPEDYQIWFTKEAFRALNEGARNDEHIRERRSYYENLGLSRHPEVNEERTQAMQKRIGSGELNYNEAVDEFYGKHPGWIEASSMQTASFDELVREQKINETADHRMVGFVVETRPETLNIKSMTTIRKLGATKIQIGVQSVQEEILRANNRNITLEKIKRAFTLLRIFGFKIHTHFMLNMYTATPESDKADYYEFVNNPAYLPDEVKLYPTSLVADTYLNAKYADGTWRPYTLEELIELLTYDTLITKPYTRISRMIRDISSKDILVGNTYSNVRQLVEKEINRRESPVEEMRFREIRLKKVKLEDLHLEVVPYTTNETREFFLQWVDEHNSLAGFLRLSLPNQDFIQEHLDELPVGLEEAMIREVHVYGKVEAINSMGENAQHIGLGKMLVAKAKEIAKEAGYKRINVISSIGTRKYYEHLGFKQHGLYQQAEL
ncbi:MAG: tRNA uridine(34) 5-carboxymethylaminomethyl modification radical SAM/GNAT enzyme Elp3 [Coriobacteriia bacterium]|nr:tRNA uridine(34) 5-carboxymethylaminomethyl modification radical SAM/GNAT enzyme Elp3 [Coriobacteriia bacterium]